MPDSLFKPDKCYHCETPLSSENNSCFCNDECKKKYWESRGQSADPKHPTKGVEYVQAMCKQRADEMRKANAWKENLKAKEKEVEKARCEAAGIKYVDPEEPIDVTAIFNGQLPTEEEIAESVRNARR